MFAELYIWLKLIHVVSALAFFGLGEVHQLRKGDLYQAGDFAALRAVLARFEGLLRLYKSVALLLLGSGLALGGAALIITGYTAFATCQAARKAQVVWPGELAGGLR